MGDKSINIIVMRDQSKSFTLGFSTQTFRIMIAALVLVPLLLVVSIWFGLTYYNKYITGLEESVQLRKNIEQNRQTVTRLANLERFLQKYSPDMLGLLVPDEQVDINNLPVIKGDKDILMSELAVNLAGENMSFDILGDTKEKKIPEEAESLNSEKAVQIQPMQQKEKQLQAEKIGQEKQTGTELVQAESKEPEQQGTDLQNQPSVITAELPEQNHVSDENGNLQGTYRIDDGFVSLEQVRAKVSTQNINVSFALKNTGKKSLIQGDVRFYIYSEVNGKFVLQELNKTSDDSFKIRNLKNFKSSVSIMGIKIGEKAQFMVEILIDGTVIFRQLYPLVH